MYPWLRRTRLWLKKHVRGYRFKRRWITARRWFFAGLLVWIPLAVTIWIVTLLIGFMDNTMLLVPESYRPAELLGFNIPGIGAVLALGVVMLTGMAVANIIGQRFVDRAERLLNRVPLVRHVYSSVKQVVQTFMARDSRSFRQAVLVEYPRLGLWSVAFVTADAPTQAGFEHQQDHWVTLFVPTAPNPTTGFVIIACEQELRPLDMSVDQAFRMVVSLGMVAPEVQAKAAPPGSVELRDGD